MPAYLVTGATGRQGGAVARCLLAKKQTVHALVRDPDAPAARALQACGAKLFAAASLSDIDAVQRAAAGTAGIFLNTFPNLAPNVAGGDRTPEINQAKAVLSAARASGSVRAVVVSTAYKTGFYSEWSASDPSFPAAGYYAAKHAIEELVRASGLAHAILRPAWLFHNYLPPAVDYHFPELRSEKVLAAPFADDPRVKMAHLDAEDVGRFAAEALLAGCGGEWSGREVEMGFENFVWAEVARKIGAVAGVEVKVRGREEGEDLERAREKVGTIGFMELAGRADMTIAGLDGFGIRLTTFDEFLEREGEVLRGMFA